ncbi:MAG: hypothetical protein CVT67_09555 [Actinobacteria bacterium HGW-Actinobacteria-7]|nr:MAG: hypothetical protein CVT67_09555 [Actinobacteria bacterium HGW-Actinobacteria-7]
MRRLISATTVLALALVLFGGAGCAPQVEVRTGTKVVCTYGEVISDGIHTVKVPAQDAGKYKVRTITRLCPRHAQLESLYQAAQQALAAGDMAAAKKALEQVVAIDPAFAKAAAQLDTIAGGGKPAPDTSSPGGSAATTSTPDKPGDADTGSPAESLLVWAPDKISGFTASRPTVDPLTIARQYVPASGSDAVSFVIAVEQFPSAKLANSGLTAQVKRVYSRDSDTFKLNGHDVYFGTDGQRYGALGFVDGAVMVVLEMSGKSGEPPSGLKSALKAAANQLP